MQTDFENYCWEFYGRNKTYGHLFSNKLTKKFLRESVNEYLEILEDEKKEFCGDTVDREKVRDLMLAKQSGEKRIKVIINEDEFITCYPDRPGINDLYIVHRHIKSKNSKEHIGYIRWDLNTDGLITYDPLYFTNESSELNLYLYINEITEYSLKLFYQEWDRLLLK